MNFICLIALNFIINYLFILEDEFTVFGRKLLVDAGVQRPTHSGTFSVIK